MSNAENAAMKAYPPFICNEGQDDEIDINADKRMYLQEGYEKAEKDIALTWQDVKRIVEIADQLCPYTSKDMAEFQANFQTEESYYREVLKRFNDGKETNTP